MVVISENFLMMEAQQMHPLNEILQSLREDHGYSEQEIDQILQKLDHFSELIYMVYTEQKRLS